MSIIWMFPKIGGFGKPPQNGWFGLIIMENPMMDDLGGKNHYFWKHPYSQIGSSSKKNIYVKPLTPFMFINCSLCRWSFQVTEEERHRSVDITISLSLRRSMMIFVERNGKVIHILSRQVEAATEANKIKQQFQILVATTKCYSK